MKSLLELKNYRFLILLLAIGLTVSCTEDEEMDPDDDVTPVASFTTEIDGLTVEFTNISTDAVSYSWDFGDGNTSEEENPEHTYEKGDTYSVKLTVTSTSEISDDVTNDVTVSEPVVDPASLLYGDGSKTWYLLADVSGGKFPYTVQPTDNSVFWWAFGANIELCVRECILDDTWTFNEDGSFKYENNGDFFSAGAAWGEEACFDATVASNWVGKDGQDLTGWDSGTHQYAYDDEAETLTVTGGFVGLHNATPAGEVTSPAASIEYEVLDINVNGAVDTLVIQVVYPNGDSPTGSAYWRSTLVSYENESDIVVTEECPGVPDDVPPSVAAADPSLAVEKVLSVFSDAYTSITGVNLDPNWGQNTDLTEEKIGENNILKLAGFNYQGIDFSGNVQDVSGYTHVHVDMYTTNAEKVNFFLIGEGETPFELTIKEGEWVGYDIALSEFTAVDLTKVIQFKLDGGDGQRTIYLDNMYFYTE